MSKTVLADSKLVDHGFNINSTLNDYFRDIVSTRQGSTRDWKPKGRSIIFRNVGLA